MTPLPIDDVIPDLLSAIRAEGRAVLMAPPGAGKTTRVPLALLDAIPGRIVMLHDPINPDLPCPWCQSPTFEEDRNCASCGQHFG